MPYIDAKGRPELVVNRAIKLGMAFFKPVAPAVEAGATGPAASPVAAAAPSAARRPAVRAVAAGSAAPPTAAGRGHGLEDSADPRVRQVQAPKTKRASSNPPKRAARGKVEAVAPRPGKRKAGGAPMG